MPVGNFFITFFCQDQHNCEKCYEKTRVFLTSFESLPKFGRFQKIFEKLLFILVIHVMLVLGKLWILYFPRPLKCCTYELLIIRGTEQKRFLYHTSAATGPRTTTTVALFWIANFVSKKIFHTLVYHMYISCLSLLYISTVIFQFKNDISFGKATHLLLLM